MRIAGGNRRWASGARWPRWWWARTAATAALAATALAVAGCVEPLTGEEATPGSGSADGASAPSSPSTSPSTSPSGAPSASGDSDGDQVGEIGPGQPVTIDRVIDGDSLEVVLADGTPREVRLLGINAPELRSRSGDTTCPGAAARDELDILLASGPVTLVGAEVDRFDRLLADLHVGTVHVNRELVASGWALALWSGDDPALPSAMLDAADAELGWWGDGCGSADAVLVVSDAQPNPPGPDDEVLDQEWIEITNDGDAPVDLDGWTVRDETTSNRFVLSGPVLAPGDRLRVHTGGGRDGDGRLFLDERFPVWNNGGDTALVVDPEGRIATHRFL